MPNIRVEFVGGHADYGLGASKRAGYTWDLKIRWHLEGMPPNAPSGDWDYGGVAQRPQGWPADGISNVAGWLFQHVKSDFRPASARNWTADEPQAGYWEMWAVIAPGAVVPALDGQRLGFTALSGGHHDAYCIGDKAIRALAQRAGGQGSRIIYRKVGRAYFMPWANLAAVNRWLAGARVGGLAHGGAGGLPMSLQPPAQLPAHGLKRVTAIDFQHQDAQAPVVTKWDELKAAKVPFE